jgi:hypothetical protein
MRWLARLAARIQCCTQRRQPARQQNAAPTGFTCAYTLQDRSVLLDRSPTPVMSSTNLRAHVCVVRFHVCCALSCVGRICMPCKAPRATTRAQRPRHRPLHAPVLSSQRPFRLPGVCASAALDEQAEKACSLTCGTRASRWRPAAPSGWAAWPLTLGPAHPGWLGHLCVSRVCVRQECGVRTCGRAHMRVLVRAVYVRVGGACDRWRRHSGHMCSTCTDCA